MSISRASGAVTWAVVWTAIFWFGHRGPLSVVGIVGWLVWVVGGAHVTALGEWHTFVTGLRAREAARAAVYLVAALATVMIVFVVIDAKHELPTAARVSIFVVAMLPTVLFLPSWLKAGDKTS